MEKIRFHFLSLSTLAIISLLALSCGSSGTDSTDAKPSLTVTATDHIIGDFTIGQVTQEQQARQEYVNTEVTIAKGDNDALTFSVTAPPTNSALPTGNASFDGTSKLTVDNVIMTLSNITAEGFSASFTSQDTGTTGGARGIQGTWVFQFIKKAATN